MRNSHASFAVMLMLLLVAPACGQALPPAFYDWAQTPPMGWNSWDCFGAGVTEEQTLANADYIEKNLKSHGWSIVTIDIQWYEPLAHTDQYRANAVLEMDANGRLLPAANRFPSTKQTHSFKPIADLLHAKGLKFGVHLLRGIPRQAVENNVPILGAETHAADIADKQSICRWNTDMYGVDMSKKGAQEYYDSVFALLASWEIDLVKVDDLLSYPYHAAEIEAIRRAIDKTGRPIILSGSPSIPSIESAAHISTHANMWRISDDFWDNWRALYEQFARLRDWTPYRGPGHFPDADMLPLGNVRAWSAKNNWTHFTHDEQITLMTLWSIARSPLILGANLPKNDDFTLSLLTNDEVIAVDQHSTNNHEVANTASEIVWLADVPDSSDKYMAIFNPSPVPAPRTRSATTTVAQVPASQSAKVSVRLADLGIASACAVRDLWGQKDLGQVADTISATINPHGAVLYRLHPTAGSDAVR
jgi:alpha-galactosidase